MTNGADQSTREPLAPRKLSPAIFAAIFALLVGAYVCIYANEHLSLLTADAAERLHARDVWPGRDGGEEGSAPGAEEEEPELRELKSRLLQRERDRDAAERAAEGR